MKSVKALKITFAVVTAILLLWNLAFGAYTAYYLSSLYGGGWASGVYFKLALGVIVPDVAYILALLGLGIAVLLPGRRYNSAKKQVNDTNR